ncbi:hypothetical protein HK101_003805 [Irineochytrium annulatum]|nr:hypothetical protein HK101_003805 [Irineochytrium annulatum]
MPNTPALVLAGASGLWASQSDVTPAQRTLAEQLMSSFSGQSHWVDRESLLDAVTGVSGSGPAYFFLMLEAMEKSGVELGLPKEVARALAAQTCIGAGMMALKEMEDPAVLRKNVTSPNGTTAAGVQVLEEMGARKAIEACVKRATERAGELADELGKQVSGMPKM